MAKVTAVQECADVDAEESSSSSSELSSVPGDLTEEEEGPTVSRYFRNGRSDVDVPMTAAAVVGGRRVKRLMSFRGGRNGDVGVSVKKEEEEGEEEGEETANEMVFKGEEGGGVAQVLRKRARAVDLKASKSGPRKKVKVVKREPTPEMGGFVPALVKKEEDQEEGEEEEAEEEAENKNNHPSKKKKKKGQKKTLSTKLSPPNHWEEMYSTVKEMRSRISAPVDTMGCERLADHTSPPIIRRFQTLISLMLSSQTKDTVNAVAMKNLKDGLPGGLCLQSILDVEPERLDELIRSVGFHNRKTQYIKQTAIILRDRHAGDIPDSIEGLTALPGVGPKMAYLCLSVAWDRTEGIGVDIHVHRITNLWGWNTTSTPEQTREALQSWLPKDRWREINHMLVGFGQSVCLPRGRKCGECVLATKGICRAAFMEGGGGGGGARGKMVKKKMEKKKKKKMVENEDGDGDEDGEVGVGVKKEEDEEEQEEQGVSRERRSKRVKVEVRYNDDIEDFGR